VGVRVPSGLAVAVGLTVAGSACASIPDSGSVVAGQQIPAAAPEALRVIPPDPVPGAEPQQVVEGFLQATDAVDRYEVARRYLTRSAGQRWDPGDRVVYGPPAVVRLVGTDTATVTVPVLARIDRSGRYTPSSTTEQEVQTLRLERDDSGEWRIGELPDDVLVSLPAAERVLRPYPVYFGTAAPTTDADVANLVPDVRWFPARSDSATLVVQALLDGPSDPLFQAVTTGVPDGLGLAASGVGVVDGVATVDLTAEYLAAGFPTSPAGRLFQAQLVGSLAGLPGIREVRVAVEGRPLGLLDESSPRTETTVAGRPYVLLRAGEATDPAPAEPSDDVGEPNSTAGSPPGATIARPQSSAPVGPSASGPAATSSVAEPTPSTGGTGASSTPTEGGPGTPDGAFIGRLGEDVTSPVTEEPGLSRLAARISGGLAVSADARRFAGIGEDGSNLLTQVPNGLVQEVVRGGRALTTPSFDPGGWLWTASREPVPDVAGTGVTLLAVPPTRGRPVAVPVAWPDGSPAGIVALRISRDGTRALLVAERPDGRVSVQVRGVARDPAGRPTGLSPTAFSLLPDLVSAEDATWVSSDTIAVLSAGGGGTRVDIAMVGGSTTDVTAPAGAVSVTSGVGERSLVVGADGAVYVRAGNGWQPFGPAWSPAFPG
jgi:hypothetical protein